MVWIKNKQKILIKLQKLPMKKQLNVNKVKLLQRNQCKQIWIKQLKKKVIKNKLSMMKK